MGMVDFNRQGTKAKLLLGEKVKWIENSRRRDYIRGIVLSCPKWQGNEELQALKALAKKISDDTGVPHELDHEVPVNHPLVCGLTVPWNLRIRTRKHNNAKSNTWMPDQLDFFDHEPYDWEAVLDQALALYASIRGR